MGIPLLLASLRSLMILSRERGLCPFRDDDSLELDESDEPLSDALESDEPIRIQRKNKIGKQNRFLLIEGHHKEATFFDVYN